MCDQYSDHVMLLMLHSRQNSQSNLKNGRITFFFIFLLLADVIEGEMGKVPANSHSRA
jgi:hypothetical protein